MLELFKAIREDALLMSVIIFPLGNIILILSAKLVLFPKTNIGKLLNDFLSEYKKSIQAQVRLDGHIESLIDKVDSIVSSIWDFRRYLDLQLDDLRDSRDRSLAEHTEILDILKHKGAVKP